ncbi:MAG: hypothetical protein Q7T73_17100, partial [Beijerinckiaceae bacterium]|nr:hypothetical protein [Beijerinckiaceae bacterium]
MIAAALIGLVGTLATTGVFGGGSDSSEANKAPTGENTGNCINSGSVGGDMTCQSDSSAPASPSTLKATFKRSDPGSVYSLAFLADPGLPRESDGWPELSARGG